MNSARTMFASISAPIAPYTVVIQSSQSRSGWFAFTAPHAQIVAHTIDEISHCLDALDIAVANGFYCAGYLAYEAANGIDTALKTHPENPNAPPLMWFGIYSEAREVELPTRLSNPQDYNLGTWHNGLQLTQYEKLIEQIKAQIASGASYQVNLTWPMHSKFTGDAWKMFVNLQAAQNADYAAYIALGSHSICSASPELFFRLDEEMLTCRPMKGSWERSKDLEQDQHNRTSLATSEKNLAENLMITDMIRNDLGQIAKLGSVQVTQLFEIEAYPTIYQMTSTVQAKSDESIATILRKLFPCASITGAPKVKTMEIIHALEQGPRGIYTGTIGYIFPYAHHAQFNVAIRTVSIDHVRQQAEYGVGSGITWDSNPSEEYQECLAKAQILNYLNSRDKNNIPSPIPGNSPTEIFETLRWDLLRGFFEADAHLQRMTNSAMHFEFALPHNAKELLHNFVHADSTATLRVRLGINRAGVLSIAMQELDDIEGRLIGLAPNPISSDQVFLYHKTNERRIYKEVLQQLQQVSPQCEDVILWNSLGNICETTIANIVFEQDGKWITPPVSAGLLNGIFRRYLIKQEKLVEENISFKKLQSAQRFFLINSVRGWMECQREDTVKPGSNQKNILWRVVNCRPPWEEPIY